MNLADALRADALSFGFDGCRILRATDTPDLRARLIEWLDKGCEGDMAWIRETLDRRADPRALWPNVRSIVMLSMNYGPPGDALENLAQPGRANISVYARHRDYHDVIKGKLKLLASKLFARAGGEFKVFVDTAPIMEKPLAERAGLGWQGKHTNLVSREHGSWLFLGSIFTTLELPPDAPELDHCGKCSACIEACPTRAIVAPYRLDARRCVSYLTIEHKGPIPHKFREAIGNRVYGCDDCLAVCPWNKFASQAREAKFVAREDLRSPSLAEFVAMDEARFRSFFSGNPVKRIGHARFSRNILIGIGNSGDIELARAAESRLVDASALVRGAAVWALSRLLDADRFAALAALCRHKEKDAQVEDEWRHGLESSNGEKA